MNRIIKSASFAELSAVRSLSAPQITPLVVISKADDERDRLNQRLAALEEAARQREILIATLREDVVRAREDGQAEGHKVGLTEAQDRQAERLTLLESTLGDVRKDLAGKVESLDRLAVRVARECLDRILNNPAYRADLLGQIIDTQVKKIDKAMLVGIEVSEADFPGDTLQMLLPMRAPVAITVAPDIPPGGCSMVLRLGRMEVGLNQQWPALSQLLDDMSDAGASL